MTAKPRETYDIAETAAKWGAALDRLRAEQKPGVKSGRGGKAAVLQAVRDRLQALASEGYTTGQIADALREVSPRMVRAALREAAREGAKPNKRRAARRTRVGAAGSGDGRHTGLAANTTPDRTRPADGISTGLGANGAVPSERPPADPGARGTSGVAFTPEQRAQYQIPPWADGTDVRPGETLDRYAIRKRVAGPPKGADELRKFIGEGNRGR